MSVLFENCTAVLMDEAGTVLKNAWVAAEGRRIVSVGAVRPDGKFDRVIDCAGKVLMPGLVNAHTHIPMTLMRGYAGGHDLQTWLNDYIFPAEAKLDARAVRAGADLALAELIAGGCTAVNDMYYFSDTIAQACADAGINANINRCVTVFEPLDRPEDFSSCREMRALADEWNGRNDGQIRIDVSLHAEYTSFLCPNMWDYLAAYAAEKGLGMHVHVSETRAETEECKARHGGKTPFQVLDEHGVWNVRAIAAHCVWAEEADIDLMARRGIACAHNPFSNLKLGSGVAPVPAMLKKGVNVALGTDGVSSNNSHDLFEEMKLAATLHGGISHDPAAVTARDALKMATVNGAKALGRHSGRVAPGFDADLILLDFDRPNLIPCHDVSENIVFSAHPGDVCLTMAGGKILYENGEYLTLDWEKIKAEALNYGMPKLFG